MTKIKLFFNENNFGKAFKWFLAVFFPFALILIAEFTNSRGISNFFNYLGNKIFLILFLYVFLSIIIFSFALIIKRFWLSSLIFGSIIMIAVFVNVIKFNITSYPFFPWDILLVGNLGEITGFAEGNLTVTPKMIIGVIAFIIYIFLLFISDLKFSFKKVNIIPFCTVILAYGLFFTSNTVKDKFLPVLGLTPEMLKYQDINYFQENGFIGSFLQNCCNMKLDKTNQYSLRIDELYNKYKIDDNTVSQIKNIEYKPNIICIMSESFCDLRLIDGLELSENIYNLYDDMALNSIYGNISVPVNGGGTSRSEFQFLSGLSLDISFEGALPYQQFVKNEVPTLASYAKILDYKTVGIHPYMKKFYQRNKVYPLLGFDEFIGIEDLEQRSDFIKEDEYVTDDYLTDLIIEQIEEAEQNNNPLFLYAITMQNHYPYYDGKFKSFSDSVEILNNISEKTKTSLSSYASGVKESIQALKKLYDYINNSDRPTILVFFGDHMPVIDESDQFFKEFKLSNETPNRYNEFFQSSYFIYTNDKSKQIKTNRNTSVAMLGCDILELASFPKIQVFKFLDEMRNSDIEFINGKVMLDKDGNYYFNDSNNQWFIDHKIITYNILREKDFTDNFEVLKNLGE